MPSPFTFPSAQAPDMPEEQEPKTDPLLALKAAQRLNDLRKGYPVAGENGQSRFIKPPESPVDSESSVLLRMLSRFLRPGQQTRPATPYQPGEEEAQ